MKDWFDALPIEVALAFMWVVGIVRTSIVYALGALAAEAAPASTASAKPWTARSTVKRAA